MSELSDLISIMKMIAKNEDGAGIKNVLKDIYNMVDSNEDVIKQAYELDRQHTGRKENIKIKLILDAIEQTINYEFKEDNIFQDIDSKKVLEVKQNIGVIGVFYDGDILITLDLICKALKTNNAIIFNVDITKNIGTNKIIIDAVKQILRNNNKPDNLVNINLSDNDNLLLEDIDLAIVVGSKEKIRGFKQISNCKILESGYGYNEIYVEDDTNKEFILKILEKEDIKVTLYIKEGLELGIKGTPVKDVYEAIEIINKNGAGYATAIFTNDENNAKEYIKKVNCKYAFSNASSTLARELDISIEDLFYKKVCIV